MISCGRLGGNRKEVEGPLKIGNKEEGNIRNRDVQMLKRKATIYCRKKKCEEKVS